MKEAIEEVVAEKPKTVKHKEGTKPASTSDTKEATGEKKEKAKAITKTHEYRVFDGVDAEKYRGQRQIVIKALQGLGHGFHSLDSIASECDKLGLVSKTPTAASAKYHLIGLIKDNIVEAKDTTPAPVAQEQKAA